MKLTLVKESPCQHKNNMCILGRALYHPGATILLQYVTKGCPAKLGQPLSGRKIIKSCQAYPCQVEPHQANQHQAEQEHKWKACRKKTRTITMTSNCRNQYNCAHRDWYSPIRQKQHYSSMSWEHAHQIRGNRGEEGQKRSGRGARTTCVCYEKGTN